MLAARLHGNRDLRVEQMPEPETVPAGQVRVRPEWCGICGTDLHEYAHGPLYTPTENLPQVIGHEFSAVVTETGEGVTNVRAGDRVAVLPARVLRLVSLLRPRAGRASAARSS